MNKKTKNLSQLKKLKEKVKHHNQGFEYAYGPLNKSDETKLFEQIVRDIIIDRKNLLNADKTKPKVTTRVQNNIMYAIHNGQEININELLKNVNLNHVNLHENDLRGYEILYTKDSNLKNTVPSSNNFDERIVQSDIHQQESLSKLSYAEKVAINVYTSSQYDDMNGILRGCNAPQDFDRCLMDIAVASQGLNSLPSIELPTVTRMQGKYDLDKMMKMQKNHEIEQVQGFLSTSYETQKHFGDVQIVYENVRGVSIAALSEFPDEKEYLIPPSTQIKYTGYKFIQGRHVFTSEGANVLLDTKQETPLHDKTPISKNIPISKNTPISQQLEHLVNKLIDQEEQQLANKGRISKKEAESFIQGFIDLNIQCEVITNAEKALYFKKNKSGKSAFDKDVQILLTTPKGLPLRDRFLYAASNVSNTLGFKKLSNIFNDKISSKGKALMSTQLNQNIKKIKGKFTKHIAATSTSKASSKSL